MTEGKSTSRRSRLPQGRGSVDDLAGESELKGGDIGSLTARLVKQTLQSFGEAETSSRDAGRLFFPDGIGLIELKVSIGNASAELKVASAPSSLETRITAEKGSAPESCREAGLFFAADDLQKGDKVPNTSETQASGAIAKKVKRTDPEFEDFVNNSNNKIIFKDEEGTGADRMMTQSLSDKLTTLADAVSNEWSNVKLRVTEAWDEDDEHAGNSLHYEGRAADLTTSPIDPAKLGRLGRLAVKAGFDWVWFENSAHIHVSVRK